MARSKFEVLAGGELLANGWKIDYKYRPPMSGHGYTVDYFGIFDILAYKPNILRMISIKPASNCPTSHQKEIMDFIVPEGVTKEIWRYDRSPKDKRKIRVRKWVFEKGKKLLTNS